MGTWLRPKRPPERFGEMSLRPAGKWIINARSCVPYPSHLPTQDTPAHSILHNLTKKKHSNPYFQTDGTGRQTKISLSQTRQLHVSAWYILNNLQAAGVKLYTFLLNDNCDVSVTFSSGIVISRPCHLIYNNLNNFNDAFDQSEMPLLDNKFNINVI
jgi:hypothetical protein